MQTVLTIAGFDPSSGAGVTADLMVFAAHGLFGTACITGLTVQSTLGVQAIHPTDATVVGATLECLRHDLPPKGIKIGMLSSTENILSISSYMDKLRISVEYPREVLVVLDPVLWSSSGRELVDPAGIALLREQLLPLVDWITPNLDELGLLSGANPLTRDDIPNACRTLQASVGKGVRGGRLGILATGGHIDPPDDFLLTPDGKEVWLPGERVHTRATHGTGCALSSAFLSRLVLGDSPLEAAKAAKDYVTGAMRSASCLGAGLGPMRHLWQLANVKDGE